MADERDQQADWPSERGIGIVDEAACEQTVRIARETRNAEGQTVLTKAPEGLAYTNDYAQRALTALKAAGADVPGRASSRSTSS